MALTERPRLKLTQLHVKLMLDANLIGPHEYELIEGDLIAKMPQNQPHSRANDNAYDCLTALFGRGFVQHSAPIRISETSAPEPDLAVLRQHRSHYTDNPVASECLLVVEISDSTLAYDRTVKAELYARAAIPEYWIVNLTASTVIVHRGPTPDGYRDIPTLGVDEPLTPLARQENPIATTDLLP